MDRLDAEATDDALRVLRDLAAWELTPHAWERAAAFLERIADALETDDAYALRRAVAGLESTVRVKALRIGSDDVRGVPQVVLERQMALVHALVERRAAPEGGDRAR
ncbi:CATRA system-associated protein [Dactylosporangium sp. CA-139066]|uniref:CATRA system-associated protein n=1 Tax=Dactylosporangium sp. CA-139066 TaxID=3239930 RepID=UPI003D903295